jgi:hypothetical protein
MSHLSYILTTFNVNLRLRVSLQLFYIFFTTHTFIPFFTDHKSISLFNHYLRIVCHQLCGGEIYCLCELSRAFSGKLKIIPSHKLLICLSGAMKRKQGVFCSRCITPSISTDLESMQDMALLGPRLVAREQTKACTSRARFRSRTRTLSLQRWSCQ